MRTFQKQLLPESVEPTYVAKRMDLPEADDNVLDISEHYGRHNKSDETFDEDDVVTGTAEKYECVEISPNSMVRPLQKWEGVVVSVGKDSFSARLRDLTLKNVEIKEQADFSFFEVHAKEQNLIKVGATFYWTISLRIDPRTGHPNTENSIFFKRQPIYTKRKIDNIKSRAMSLHEIISQGTI